MKHEDSQLVNKYIISDLSAGSDLYEPSYQACDISSEGCPPDENCIEFGRNRKVCFSNTRYFKIGKKVMARICITAFRKCSVVSAVHSKWIYACISPKEKSRSLCSTLTGCLCETDDDCPEICYGSGRCGPLLF